MEFAYTKVVRRFINWLLRYTWLTHGGNHFRLMGHATQQNMQNQACPDANKSVLDFTVAVQRLSVMLKSKKDSRKINCCPVPEALDLSLPIGKHLMI